jgi:hypothetical protein
MTSLGLWTLSGALLAAAPRSAPGGEVPASEGGPPVVGPSSASGTRDGLPAGRADTPADEQGDAFAPARPARTDPADDARSARHAAPPASDELELSDEYFIQQRSWTDP